MVDYENKRLVKEQLEQIESLKIVQAAASNTDSALGEFVVCQSMCSVYTMCTIYTMCTVYM